MPNEMVKGSVTFEEIVDIPAAGQQESETQRPKRKDLMPAAADNLLFAFRRCHNYIAGSEGMQKPEAFWELLKLIFCKIEDERSGVLQFYTTSAELSSGMGRLRLLRPASSESLLKRWFGNTRTSSRALIRM